MLRNVNIPDLIKFCQEYAVSHDLDLSMLDSLKKIRPLRAEEKSAIVAITNHALKRMNFTIKEYGDCTPLHLAVMLGNVPATKHFLALGVIAIKNRAGKYPHQIELDQTRVNQPEYVAKYKEALNLVINNPAYRQSLKADQAEERRLHNLWVAEQQREAKRKAALEYQHQAEIKRRAAEATARSQAMQASIQASNDAILKKRAADMQAFSKSLDKMANINQPPTVKPLSTVPFKSPIFDSNKIYKLEDTHRSGGTLTNKTSSIFLADAGAHPENFTGFNGKQCSYNDILYANQVEMNAQEPPDMWGAAVSNKIHQYTTDPSWACAPKNIQPSTAPKPK